MPVAMLLPSFHDLAPSLLYWAAVVAFLMAALWRPRIGLYILVPTLPLQTFRYNLHGFPLGEQFIDMMILGVILGIIFHRDGLQWVKAPLTKYFLFLTVFLYAALWKGSSYLGVAAPLSFTDPRVSDWKNYLVMPLLYVVVVATVRDVKQIRILILLMCLSFLMVNRSFHSTVSGRDFSSFSYEVRDAGQMGYAGVNGLAAYEVQFMMFLMALYAFEKKWHKLAIVGLMATGVYCLLYTFSREGYLAFVVGLVFLGLLRERKLLIGVFVLFLAWQTILPSGVQQRITMTYDKRGGQLDDSAQTRVTLWEDALSIIKEYPIIGTGLNTYRYMRRHEDLGDTHNYYLKVQLETGVLGSLLFLYLIFRMFGMGWRLYRSSDEPFFRELGLGFCAMMVTAMVLNLFGDRWTYMQVNGVMWVLLGCVVRAQMITNSVRQEAVAKVKPITAVSMTARPRLA